MATLRVQPRPTPEERPDRPLEIEVDEALTVHAATIEDWVAPRQSWDFVLKEGHDFGRANNVEAEVLYASGDDHASTLTFRLDQLDEVEDFGPELLLRFEQRNGICKTAELTATGLHVELHHILTFT